jgi:hypothetical protein
MSLPTGRRKGTCALWLKRNWVLLSLLGLAAASAALSVLLYLEPCDKKTQYDTQNITTVVNVTSYENRTVLENVRLRRGNLNSIRADAAAMAESRRVPRRRSRSTRRSSN